MDVTSEIAIFGFIAVISSAVLTPLITGRQAAHRQTADWKRQDDVADRAAATAAASLAATRSAAATANETLKIAKTVHTLVNSNLTQVKQAELAATELSLLVMRKYIPSPDEQEVLAINTATGRITALKADLASREIQLEKSETDYHL